MERLSLRSGGDENKKEKRPQSDGGKTVGNENSEAAAGGEDTRGRENKKKEGSERLNDVRSRLEHKGTASSSRRPSLHRSGHGSVSPRVSSPRGRSVA